MQKRDRNMLIEYDDEEFNPRVLMNEPGCQMVLLSMRAGQLIPEHVSQGIVTVQAIRGRVTLFAGFPNELCAGDVISIQNGVPYRIEAIEDSALLALSTGGIGPSMGHFEELDSSWVPKPQWHPRQWGLPSSVSSHRWGSSIDAPFSATTRSSLGRMSAIPEGWQEAKRREKR